VKALVTGGAGFIGSHLCAELTAGGAEVSVLDDLSTGRRDNIAGLPVRFIEASITDYQAVSAAVAGIDTIVHLAAVASVPESIEAPMRTHDVNVTGTLNVLQCARDVNAHVVVASSAAVYGNASGLIRADANLPHPLSPYAASKLATETYATSWQESYGLPTLALRFFNVFGPRQRLGDAYAAVIPAFISAAVSGQPLFIHGDGEQTRDFIPVRTVAGLLAHAAQHRVTSPSPVDVAFGQRTSLLELVNMLENITRCRLRRAFTPTRPGDIRDSSADSSAMRGLFPHLQHIDLQEALEETVEWWRSEQPSTGRRKGDKILAA
jgi:UDP-glucose 4-epimerase